MNGEGFPAVLAEDGSPDLTGTSSPRPARGPLPDCPDEDLIALLLARGAASAADLHLARDLSTRLGRPFDEILLLRDAVSEVDLLSAQAEIGGFGLVNLANAPPDPALVGLVDPSTAIALDCVPWQRMGTAVVVVASTAHGVVRLRQLLGPYQRVIIALAPRAQVLEAQVTLYGDQLARRGEGRVPQSLSCRGWRPESVEQALMLALLGLCMLAIAAPLLAVKLVFGLTMLVFCGNILLKTAAYGATLRAERSARRSLDTADQRLARVHAPDARHHPHDPVVTILIALYREAALAPTLISALSRLDYPQERLDVILCTEAHDTAMHRALAACTIPPWLRIVKVPPGHPQTKPRALNFGLNFARGQVVGVYDAEDRPEPDQLRKVVSRFAEVGEDVACLQGRLDYYNAGHNMLSRCFAIEYASWFRVLLPGVQRLGCVVPLGGTTLFLRRDVLERIGAWDAHNVTEDAELGLRLARNGFRTGMVDTTTYEEANAAVWPWVKQRSRWQKGYMMTWAAAMRRPVHLWCELGTARFIALQVQVLFAVLGFLVAPVLWSLLGVPFGMPHPLDAVLSPLQYGVLGLLMVSSFVVSIALSVHATRAAHLRPLRPYILLSEFYHVLGTIAAWRAAFEMLARPFYWSKTEHGGFTKVGASAKSVAGYSRRQAFIQAHAPLASGARRRPSTDDP